MVQFYFILIFTDSIKPFQSFNFFTPISVFQGLSFTPNNLFLFVLFCLFLISSLFPAFPRHSFIQSFLVRSFIFSFSHEISSHTIHYGIELTWPLFACLLRRLKGLKRDERTGSLWILPTAKVFIPSPASDALLARGESKIEKEKLSYFEGMLVFDTSHNPSSLQH